MPTVKAKIISQPPEGSRTVFVSGTAQPSGSTFTGPFIRGSGTTTYVCGLCGTLLAENIIHGQVRNIVLQCPKCHSYNDIP